MATEGLKQYSVQTYPSKFLTDQTKKLHGCSDIGIHVLICNGENMVIHKLDSQLNVLHAPNAGDRNICCCSDIMFSIVVQHPVTMFSFSMVLQQRYIMPHKAPKNTKLAVNGYTVAILILKPNLTLTLTLTLLALY